MEKRTMTIHRALSELKLIDSKINKQISEIVPTGITQKGKLVNGHIKEDDFAKSAQSKFDSVNDLIKTKTSLKSAIVKANAETTVKIGDKTMTIADAINFKAVISYKKSLVDVLKARYNQSVALLNTNNDKVEKNLQAILEAALGKENVKTSKEDVDAVAKPFLEANQYLLVDPLKVADVIESIEKEVSEFEAEVDAALSEVNAITTIEI
jgi:hypothetical protein